MKKYFLPFTLVALFAACGAPEARDNDAADGAHDHSEAEPLTFTVYTDSTELFVEFAPLVVGQETRFAAHFTRMGRLFRPVVEGTATVTLQGTGAGSTATADAPSSPGIFPLALKPAQAGRCKLVFTVHTGIFTDTLIIDGLSVYADAHDAAHAEAVVPAGDIAFSKEQAWKIPFATEQVKRGAFASSVRVGAEVEPAVSGEQVLAARSAGVVHLLGNAPLEGMPVKAGQALFTLSSQGVGEGNVGALIQQARNDRDRAKADLERIEALYTDKLATQQEVLRARNDFANAEAMLNQTASAQSITSNMDGYVRSLHVREGQFVQAGTVLATVARNTRLSIHADVPVQAFARLGGVQGARIKAQDGSVRTLEQLNGTVLSVGQGADGLYVPVRLEVDGTQGLLPGSVVEVWLLSPTMKDAMTIPLSAVLEQEGRSYCYVQTAGETMDKRTITLGANDGLRAEVREGLAPGERVVSIGAMDVKLATAGGALPAHGHEH
ncbi:MAG: efflux RND transporter periplasmic adaptor subunit [Flavobacteriales bacterium]|nr:efflux RND transporter periplasmic adaptor subunit [Flavobacteriales bacterium]